jgi:hypothetical protein
VNLNLLIAHPVLALVLSQLLGAGFVLGVILGISPLHRRALIASVTGWFRRTFTSAGDSCIDCARWSLPVACLSCGRTRILTATKTIATNGQTAASIAHARATRDAERRRFGFGTDGRAVSIEERRRRDALTAFDEMDLDLDEQAVN